MNWSSHSHPSLASRRHLIVSLNHAHRSRSQLLISRCPTFRGSIRTIRKSFRPLISTTTARCSVHSRTQSRVDTTLAVEQCRGAAESTVNSDQLFLQRSLLRLYYRQRTASLRETNKQCRARGHLARATISNSSSNTHRRAMSERDLEIVTRALDVLTTTTTTVRRRSSINSSKTSKHCLTTTTIQRHRSRPKERAPPRAIENRIRARVIGARVRCLRTLDSRIIRRRSFNY